MLTGDAWFNLLYQKSENITEYKRIISLSNNTKTLIQDIKFNQMGQIVNNYNLEGLKLYSNALSWAHYMTAENCDFEGKLFLMQPGVNISQFAP